MSECVMELRSDSVPRETAAVQTVVSERTIVALLMALGVFRVLLLGTLPLELAPDEAYYWDWSRQLDYGYYSKPPLIAWLMAGTQMLFGSSEWALRVPAAILSALGLWAAYGLSRDLYDARVAKWTLATMAASPANAALGMLMTIDAPFLCCWLFALWTGYRCFGGPRIDWKWWWPAVLSTGLGFLSKQTMVAIVPLWLAWLAVRRQQPFPWRPFVSWAASSLLFLIPVFVWNVQHQWITVQHTREHFRPELIPWHRHLTYYLEFVAGQAALVSPGIYLLTVVAGLAGVATWRRQSDRERLLLTFGMLPMLAVTGLSFVQRVQPNWPGAFQLTTMMLTAAWYCGAWRCPLFPDRWRSFLPAAGLFAVGQTVVLYLIPAVVPWLGLDGSSLDLAARLRGWRTFARAVHEVRAEVAATTHKAPLLVLVTGRNPVSELSYYLPDQPRVYQWNWEGEVLSQHDVWGGPTAIQNESALILLPESLPIPPELQEAFSLLESRGTIDHPRGAARKDRYAVWYGEGLTSWPAVRVPLTREAMSRAALLRTSQASEPLPGNAHQ